MLAVRQLSMLYHRGFLVAHVWMPQHVLTVFRTGDDDDRCQYEFLIYVYTCAIHVRLECK